MDEKQTYRIRKLTPLECWRLMGFDDEDFRKAEAVNSKKKAYVVEYLNSKGYNLDTETLDNLIESAVLELKKS